jgi:hypothetical protein
MNGCFQMTRVLNVLGFVVFVLPEINGIGGKMNCIFLFSVGNWHRVEKYLGESVKCREFIYL